MINDIFMVVLFLFFSKLLWNIGVVFSIEQQFRKCRFENENQPSSVSMAVLVEILLLSLLILISVGIDGYYWSSKGILIALFGFSFVCVSYVLAALAGKILRRSR